MPKCSSYWTGHKQWQHDLISLPQGTQLGSLTVTLDIRFSLVGRALTPTLHNSILILSGALNFHSFPHGTSGWLLLLAWLVQVR